MELLAYLFLHLGEERSIQSLGAATSIPQQTLSREVARLVAAGILVDRRLGRMHLVSANQAGPYFPELASMLLKALGPRALLAKALAKVEGIEEAHIFGSWARRYQGEHGLPPGDVDVVVVGTPDVELVYEACREVGEQSGQEVNPVVLTRNEWRSKSTGFIDQVRSAPLVTILGKVR